MLRGRDPRECEEIRGLMSEYADQELDAPSQARVEEHVGFCPDCRQVLGNLRETLRRVGLLSNTLPGDAADSAQAATRIAGSWRDRD